MHQIGSPPNQMVPTFASYPGVNPSPTSNLSTYGSNNNTTSFGLQNQMISQMQPNSPVTPQNNIQPTTLGSPTVSPMNQILAARGPAETCQLQIYFFNFQATDINTPPPTCNVIAFDIINLKDQFTLWTHKVSVWKNIFQTDRVQPKEQEGQYIDPFFYNFDTAGVRVSPTNNDIMIKTTNTAKKIQRWVMYMYVPLDWSEETVKTEISKLAAMAQDPVIQTQYHLLLQQSFHASIAQDCLPGSGRYWSMLNSAILYNCQFVYYNYLNDMFRNEEINKIIPQMFNFQNIPINMWRADYRRFAYQT